MKVYKITIDDQLAATLERIAMEESRAPSEVIAIMLRDWAFGIARKYSPVTPEEIERFKKRNVPRVLLTAKQRNSIFERDNGKCFYCAGQMVYQETWHIDHRTPVSAGGSNDPENLVLSCVRCNLKKGAKMPEVA